MRITGGKARSISLKVPRNGEVRPAMDCLREQVFNRIGAGIQQAEVWDCFAGSGAYGLEALSRGARFCTFFEKSVMVCKNLQRNVSAVCKSAQREISECVKIIPHDLFSIDFAAFLPPDFIFFDPPYRFWDEQRTKIEPLLLRWAKIFSQATLVVEFPAEWMNAIPLPWEPTRPLQVPKKLHEPCIECFRIVS